MEARATNAISTQRYQLLARKPLSPTEYWGITIMIVIYCSSLGICHRALSEQGTEPQYSCSEAMQPVLFMFQRSETKPVSGLNQMLENSVKLHDSF